MTNAAKDAEAFLEKAICLTPLIRELEDAYDTAFERASQTTKKPNNISVQTSKTNATENKFVECSALAAQVMAEKEKQEKLLCEILSVINQVNSARFRTYLIARYINNKTRGQIAESINVTPQWIDKRIHPRSLEIVASVLKKKRS